MTSVPLDNLLVVLLGVMRKLMYLWLSGPLCVRLPGRIANQISEALLVSVPFVPGALARKPRSFKSIELFKGTEYRLLYTGPVVIFPTRKIDVCRRVYLYDRSVKRPINIYS